MESVRERKYQGLLIKQWALMWIQRGTGINRLQGSEIPGIRKYLNQIRTRKKRWDIMSRLGEKIGSKGRPKGPKGP